MKKSDLQKGLLGQQHAIYSIIPQLFGCGILFDLRQNKLQGDLLLENGLAIQVKADFQSWKNGGTVPVEYKHTGRKSGDERGWLQHCIVNHVDWIIYSHWKQLAKGHKVAIGSTAIEVSALSNLIYGCGNLYEKGNCTDNNGETSNFYRVPIADLDDIGALHGGRNDD